MQCSTEIELCCDAGTEYGGKKKGKDVQYANAGLTEIESSCVAGVVQGGKKKCLVCLIRDN